MDRAVRQGGLSCRNPIDAEGGGGENAADNDIQLLMIVDTVSKEQMLAENNF